MSAFAPCSQPSRSGLALLLLPTIFGCGAQVDAAFAGTPTKTLDSADAIMSRFAQAEDQRRNDLREYSVTRKYTLHNPRFNKNAEMKVKAIYRLGDGKTFQILSASGAPDVHHKVFERLLDMETEASRSNATDPSRLTADNYRFKLAGTDIQEGRKCYVIELLPKQKSKYLLQGKAWIEAEEFALVRMEGRPSANLSFWVGKPYIVQRFQKAGGFWMSAHNRSLAETRLLGSTELTIDYTGYQFQLGEAERVAMRQPRTRHCKESVD
jgi:hypothetical protein